MNNDQIHGAKQGLMVGIMLSLVVLGLGTPLYMVKEMSYPKEWYFLYFLTTPIVCMVIGALVKSEVWD